MLYRASVRTIFILGVILLPSFSVSFLPDALSMVRPRYWDHPLLLCWVSVGLCLLVFLLCNWALLCFVHKTVTFCCWNLPFMSIKQGFSSLLVSFGMKLILTAVRVATPVYFLVPFAWVPFYPFLVHAFTLRWCLYLLVRFISWRQQKNVSCLLIHSVGLLGDETIKY